MKDLLDISLYDAMADMDCTQASIEEVCAAFAVLREGMEEDGFQNDDSFDKAKGLAFARRFPMHLSTFNVICHRLEQITKELEADKNRIFEAWKAQKEANSAPNK